MRVSVIVPVYGVEKYLDKCVSSIVNQTYNDLEIILIDDGGVDKCPLMCDEWAKKDSRIVVIHKENGGQGVARNSALDIATGDYVLFVDGDDYIDENMVQRLIDATENGRYDVAICHFVIDNGLKLNRKTIHKQGKCERDELIERYAVNRTIFTGPVCKLFKRSIFDKLRFPAFRANEDAYIMHRAFGLCKNASFIEDCLYYVVIRDSSTEAKPFNKNRMHLLDCEIDLRDFISENYPHLLDKIMYRLSQACLCLIDKMYSSSKGESYTEFEEKCKQMLLKERGRLTVENCDKSLIDRIDCYLKNEKKYKKNVRKKAKRASVKKKIKDALIKIKSIFNH